MEENTKRLREKTNMEICRENDLKSILLTNTVDEVISKNKIKAVMQIIAKALISTLGPDGSTTIIQDKERQHLVTKDGLDVITNISFEDDIASTILELVKTISVNQVRTVGDGSTSAIVVANALYQELTNDENKLFKTVSPKTIIDMISTVSDYFEKKIKEMAVPVSEDLHELEEIASISMNNDLDGGKLMKDIYKKIGKYGFVVEDISEAYQKDEVEYKNGVSWKRGYLLPVFAEKCEDDRICYEKPRVFIITSDITLDNVEAIFNPLIKGICGIAKEKLLIIVNNVTDEARNYFQNVRETYKFRGNPELDFTVVDCDQTLTTSISNTKDLALLCGCEIFSTDQYTVEDLAVRCDPSYNKPDKWKFVGCAAKSTVTKGTTDVICDDTLISPEYLKKKVEQVNLIKTKIDTLSKKSVLTSSESISLFDLKYRLSYIENLSAIIHVGGKTYQERKTRQRLIEDATFAAKSALLTGYIPGGNISIPKIINKNKEEIKNMLLARYKDYFIEGEADSVIELLLHILYNGFLASYRSVLENSYLSDAKINEIINKVINDEVFYNLKLHKYEDIHYTKVINSSDTDIQIMRTCFSLITLLATSNQVITLNYNIRDQKE